MYSANKKQEQSSQHIFSWHSVVLLYLSGFSPLFKFLQQELVSSLLRTGWFQELISAWFSKYSITPLSNLNSTNQNHNIPITPYVPPPPASLSVFRKHSKTLQHKLNEEENTCFATVSNPTTPVFWESYFLILKISNDRNNYPKKTQN